MSANRYTFLESTKVSACPVIKVITIMLLSLFKRNEHLFIAIPRYLYCTSRLYDYSQDTIDEIDPWSRNLKNVLE